MEAAILILGTALLAWYNGANDNFKGVATLYGSGIFDYRKALLWATVCTFAGSLAAVGLAANLAKSFSSKGLIPDATAQMPHFVIAVLVGAIVALAIATRLGMPISTTHSLVGGLVGSGLVMAPTQFNAGLLSTAFVLPLLLSPVVAIAMGGLLYKAGRFIRLRAGIEEESCACLGQQSTVVPALDQPIATAAVAAQKLSVQIGSRHECERRYTGRFLGVEAQRAANGIHYLSAGWLSFARGLNDTPKIAGLLLLTSGLHPGGNHLFIGLAIALGGWFGAFRVAQTVSRKVTEMNAGQGLSANATAASLVTLASVFGLPVSTTHVSVGAIMGIGLATKQGNGQTMATIIAAWVFTLPLAALAAAGFAIVLTHLS